MRIKYLTVYKIEQAYGGPEEGGWYFDYRTPVQIIKVKRGAKRKLKAWQKKCKEMSTGRSSIKGGGDFPQDDVDPNDDYGLIFGEDYCVQLSSQPGKEWPSRRPRYE